MPPPTANTELDRMKKMRSNLKRSITVFETYLASATADDHDDVVFRLTHIEPLLAQFTQLNLDITCVDDKPEHDDYRDEFERKYYNAVRNARKFIKENKPIDGTDSATNAVPNNLQISNHSDNVRLPKIDLPTFNGKYDAWTCFHDTFKSMVHDKERITKIEKFYYLRSCLKEEAATIIQSLETTEENYSIAWSLLNERYDNKRIIVHNHLKNLWELPVSSKENHVHLRQMLDNINTHTRALKSLGLQVDTWDAMIIYLMTNKLDRISHQEWEKSNMGRELPTLESFLKFLQSRCQILEATQIQTQPHNTANPKGALGNNKRSVLSVTTQKDYCHYCKGEHKLYACDTFAKLSQPDKYEFVKKERLCFNCLRKNHMTEKCTCRPCKKCNKKHHTILHFERPAITEDKSVNLVNSAQVSCPAQVLLATAKIHFYDRENKQHTARVLLDSGAQAHFVTERFANLLKLSRNRVNIPVSTLNQSQTSIAHSVTTKISSRLGNYEKNISLLIVPTITTPLPSHTIDVHELNIPQNLPLADPTFHESSEIDAVLLKTKFGWIVGGSINNHGPTTSVSCNLSITNLSQDISKFWELEEAPEVKFLSPEEAEVERHFLENFRRDRDGRCIVKIPFNDKIDRLENNYHLALKQFYNLERKLSRNPKLKEQYVGFMSEYETLGHMSLSKREQIENFIPHHAVFKEEIIRVVYNASVQMNSLSFNQTQKVGPTLQDDIFSILTRARIHKILLVADITKMYRQILVDQEDRKFQKIIWRSDPNKPLDIYELNTLTYGTSAAAYLAIRSVRQVADEEQNKYPVAAEIVKRDFYVDDLITGADTIANALNLRDQMKDLLKSACFELRKWSSNDSRVTESLPAELTNVKLFEDPSTSIKTLGISWNPERDHLIYAVRPEINAKERVTKRTILSKIAQLFDPIGLLGPIIVKAKLLMQVIWKNKLDWDASVPLEIHTQWVEYRNQLPLLSNLYFERRVLINEPIDIQLHGFCDSSELAYGACIYIRSIDKEKNCLVRLLCAKSKVAPLSSKLTIPKLELCAALLLARLYKSLIRILPVAFDSTHFWSDSTITLNWINAQPSMLKTFVANRVSEIRSITNYSQWRHVPTADNPTDYISRGQTVCEFLQNEVWRYGPNWLCADEQHWPYLPLKPEPLLEMRKTVVLSVQIRDFSLPKVSSFNKLIRVIAYCKRFINNKLKSALKIIGPLTADELQASKIAILRVVQLQNFAREFNDLNKNNSVANKSLIKALNPFIDDQQLIRVGGRLKNAHLTYDEKHPIVLPKSSWVTDLIIKQTHEKMKHAGPQGTLYQLRTQYWPLDGKNTTRRVIHSCIPCFRFSREISTYVMGDLPENRLIQTRPFLNTGIDYCGPFLIKEKKLRNRNKVKVYIAIFICFSTKAVHLEVVSDLTSDAFIAALKRFFARRGKSKNIYSDNGTNFVGANSEIKGLYEFLQNNQTNKVVFDYLANEALNWHFIPPRSPHFGGLWESAVKSFKAHFLRTVGNTLLTFEELNTHAIEIEAVLNSRPLTPISSDPNDLTVLTPGHLLIGDKLMSIPDADFTDTPTNRLSNWQHLQKLKQHFWNRWHKEYLNQLNVRNKWTSHANNIEIGSMALLKEDNIPPLQWVIGRIVHTHPGPDNVVRVVSVKTASGIYKRSVKKIAILPIETNCD